MARNKDHSEIEYLRGINRKLLKKVKQLQKQVGRNIKVASRMIIDTSNNNEELEVNEPVKCKKCKSTKQSIIDMVIKTVYLCIECGYREIEKKEKDQYT